MRYLVPAQPNELQLDIDEKFSNGFLGKRFDSFRYALRRLSNEVGYRDIDTYPSKSGNMHVIITLKKSMPILERIIWQLALGSDPARELHALARVRSGKKFRFPIFLAMDHAGKNSVKCGCEIPKNLPPLAYRCKCVIRVQPDL